MRNTQIIGLFSVIGALAGCGQPLFDPYYASRVDPEISAIEPASEVGTAGGKTITIRGSGFGSDPDAVTVLIANHNARVVAVTDSELQVVTPPGPITGGAVDVLIATPTGNNAPVGNEPVPESAQYTYDTTPTTDGVDVYRGQDSYVMVQNFFHSCWGGKTEACSEGGLNTIAYVGETGIDGRAEFYRDLVYPRLHTTQVAFTSAVDATTEWKVYADFESPFASGIEELRREVGRFKLVNPAKEGEDPLCFRLGNDGWSAAGSPGADGCEREELEYRVDELQFCEVHDSSLLEEGTKPDYRADWPVIADFFEGEEGPFANTSVRMEFEEGTFGANWMAPIDLTLPGALQVQSGGGFKDDRWFWPDNMSECPDTNGDQVATLGEDGFVLTWEPIAEPEELTALCDDTNGVTCGEVEVATWLHISLTRLNLGWFGADGGGIRASIVIPDDHEFDPETGLASVGIPNDVLFQFPTPNVAWSGTNDLTDTGYLGNLESDASYFVVEIFRLTEYRIPFDDGSTREEDRPNLVFSYVTGDMAFLDWKNPSQAANACQDCLDGDGDGWVDSKDPDCNRNQGGTGTSEANATTDFTCNDGVDNDDDGVVDAEDEDCEFGWSGETNCGNGLDDDGDGWADVEDGECDPTNPFATESGDDDPAWLCADGLDNDADGWADRDDPACIDGSGTDEGGFDATFECNDGLDNDGNGDADALDPYCAQVGGRGATEAAPRQTLCADGTDNDSDGYVDAYDPDCEYAPRSRENQDFHDANDDTQPWFGFVTECYDGIDNDADGSLDSADPNCWNPRIGFIADGFMRSESDARLYPDGHPDAGEATDCSSGLDEDADGWIDGLDPDCVAAGDQDEKGFGTTVCNDGLDNNADGLIDAQSTYCKSGRGTFEGP